MLADIDQFGDQLAHGNLGEPPFPPGVQCFKRGGCRNLDTFSERSTDFQKGRTVSLRNQCLQGPTSRNSQS